MEGVVRTGTGRVEEGEQEFCCPGCFGCLGILNGGSALKHKLSVSQSKIPGPNQTMEEEWDLRMDWEKVMESGWPQSLRFRIRASWSIMGTLVLESSSKNWMSSS